MLELSIYTNRPKPLTGEVKNIDNLILMTAVIWVPLYIRQANAPLKLICWKQEMGKHKDLSESRKGQILTATWLGQSLSITGLVVYLMCSAGKP